MHNRLMWSFLGLISLLETVVQIQISLHENSHGLMQDDHEARFMVNGLHITINEDLSALEKQIVSPSHLIFQPQLLDFLERPLGTPYLERVTLFNKHSNHSVQLFLISGSSVHFHSSFFEDKVIPPLGNTSFSIVYLGHSEGRVQSTLVVHTSEGALKYSVQGFGTPCPYRLRPLVGLKVPINATISPVVYIHNPHDHPLQILEVYSSGGEFQLELPGGASEGSQAMWEIPPHSTKPVIRVKFTARHVANHTSYVRIKVGGSAEVLVVPLEVQVTPHPGLHSTQPILDFGYGGTLDKPKQLKLVLYNSGKRGLRIQGFDVQGITAEGVVSVEPHNLQVPAGSQNPVQVATVTLHWSKAFLGPMTGVLLVKSRSGQVRLTIPLSANTLSGRLQYNDSVLHFLSNDNQTDLHKTRSFSVINEFQVPVAITNLSLSSIAKEHFLISNFSETILEPGQTRVLFSVALRKPHHPHPVSTYLQIHTNASRLHLPLISCTGHLQQIIPETNNSNFELGTVAMMSTVHSLWALINTNPISVKLLEWGTDLPGTSLEFLGCGKGDKQAVISGPVYDNITQCVMKSIPPGYFGLFQIKIIAPSSEGDHVGSLWVHTPFQKLTSPLSYRSAMGTLNVGTANVVDLRDCFPGKMCSTDLTVHSTFSRPMYVTSVSPMPPDPRLIYEGSQETIIRPQSSVSLGKLHLNLAADCVSKCYTGFDLGSKEGAIWLQSVIGHSGMAELDYKMLMQRLAIFKDNSEWANISIKLDTSEVRHLIFMTQFELSWPSLLGGTTVNGGLWVPLTQVGSEGFTTLFLQNPSDEPVAVHIVLGQLYSSQLGTQQLPQEMWQDCKTCDGTPPHTFIVEGDLSWPESWPKPEIESLPIFLPSRGTANVKVVFRPFVNDLHAAVLYIRNNLTVLETVVVHGKGAIPSFKFGNRRPGSTTQLLFEITDKHLKECKRKTLPVAQVSVKRSFTARNTGELPIKIYGFKIGGIKCEGFGFKILDCVPFELLPNETKKLDIVFTPDFTLARIKRTLMIETSMPIIVNYTLLSTVPSNYLELCSKALQRPVWEKMMQKAIIIVLFVSLFVLLFVAFLDSDRVLKGAVAAMARDRIAHVHPPLDLRLVAARTTVSEERREVSKPKKKIAKKISIDQLSNCMIENGDSKKGWQVFHKIPSKERLGVDQEPLLKTTDTTMSANKRPQTIHRHKKSKSETVVVLEEENSSTTTESSNTEDQDRYIRRPKGGNKKSSNLIADSISVDPPAQTNTSILQGTAKMHYFSRQKFSKTAGRERKEKQAVGKRKSAPMSLSINSNKSSDHSSFNSTIVRASPPLPSTCVWGEKRASFSHVVARNQTITCPPSPMPQVAVETGRPPAELGPIGSKKSSVSPLMSSIKRPTPVISQSSRFFSGIASNCNIEDLNSPKHFLPEFSSQDAIPVPDIGTTILTQLQNNFQQTYSLQTALQPHSQECCSNVFENILDPSFELEDHTQNYTGLVPQSVSYINGMWDQQATKTNIHNNHNDIWSDAYNDLPPVYPLAPAQIGDLWGTAWPSTVIRPPPGLTREDDVNTMQRGLTYDPLHSMSSIWAPKEEEPWPQCSIPQSYNRHMYVSDEKPSLPVVDIDKANNIVHIYFSLVEQHT